MVHEEKITCFIHYLDGNTLNFEFSEDTDDPIHINNEIHKLVESHNLCLELDERLVFIPMANIRTIEFFPAPKKMPPGFISKAKTLSA